MTLPLQAEKLLLGFEPTTSRSQDKQPYHCIKAHSLKKETKQMFQKSNNLLITIIKQRNE